jgi:uncharacterized protein
MNNEQWRMNVTWSQYHQKIEILAAKIYKSGWDFNQIVCIAKGGLRVGDILCRIYDKPLAILFATSYGGTGNRIRGEITFSKHLAMTQDRLGNKVLLVDDLVDSGNSLQASINLLKIDRNLEIDEIRTAVIWYKSCSQIKPDYFVDFLPDSPWIHQPFEIYERTTPAELAEKYLKE